MPRSSAGGPGLSDLSKTTAGGPVIRITMSHEKLCPVHRSFIAMSGRVPQVQPLGPGI